MAETRAHLLENILPLVPYRQFVLSFPVPMWYWLHTNKKFFAKVHRLVIGAVHGYYDDDVLQLVQKIADNVKNLYVSLGYLSHDGDIVQNPALDSLFQEDSALYHATTFSIVA